MTLKTLVRSLRDTRRLFNEQQDLLTRCARIAVQQKEELNELRLEHFREIHELKVLWLVSLEQPEIDLRETLADAVTDLGNQIARLEEHIVR